MCKQQYGRAQLITMDTINMVYPVRVSREKVCSNMSRICQDRTSSKLWTKYGCLLTSVGMSSGVWGRSSSSKSQHSNGPSTKIAMPKNIAAISRLNPHVIAIHPANTGQAFAAVSIFSLPSGRFSCKQRQHSNKSIFCRMKCGTPKNQIQGGRRRVGDLLSLHSRKFCQYTA